MSTSPSTTEPSNRRLGFTRFLVPHPSFDWYVRAMSIAVAVLGVLFWVCSTIYHRELLAALGIERFVTPDEMARVLRHYTLLSALISGVVVVSTALAVTILSMFLFHRVVGPIYRLENHMRAVVEGRTSDPISFRTDDQLHELGAIYNQLLEHLGVLDEKPETPAVESADDPAGSSRGSVH